jgi:actin-like ATPase involved in cell morphogenesis
MTDWQLGIDFGTSYTVAGVAQDGNVTVVDVESNGRARIPSAVFLTRDGDILVGTAAQHQAVFAPERYEPTPKRSLGEGTLFLGDRLVAVTDLAAAVLRRVYTEACRQQGERAPSRVRVTHPAVWGEARLAVLREAVEKAGLPHVTLVSEPVAAAARIALEATSPGQHVAVYDFGGGTFDAAVLLRTSEGFEVAGPPAGRDPLGGEDIDQRIINYLGEVLAEDNAGAWNALLVPQDVAARRNAAALRAEVQRAKETLSEVSACQLWVPGLERDIQLTRTELERLIATDVDATVDTLQAAIKDAGLTAEQLSGVFLVGGSSRIPLVADALWRRLGSRPSVQDNPKSVVAMGAAAWMSGGRARPAAEATRDRPEGPAPRPAGSVLFSSALAMSIDRQAWPQGYSCTAQLLLDHSGSSPLTLRARDEPASFADAQQLAAHVAAVRSARTPGFREQSLASVPVLGADGVERRFEMHSSGTVVAMFEQYLIRDGRAIVIACPESARAVIETLTLRDQTLPPDAWFEPRFEISCWPAWAPSEQATLNRSGSAHGVSVVRVALSVSVQPEPWRERQIEPLLLLPGATVVGQVLGRVVNQLDGEVLTVQWNRTGTPMLTRLGLAFAGGQGFAESIVLPVNEQALFPALAGHAHLYHGAAVA